MSQNMDYWYDGQIRRYLIQLIRVFSHFQIQERDSNGNPIYTRVPVKYGDSSRMVAAILRQNSENILQNAPQIALTLQSLRTAPDRIQDPYYTDKVQVAERKWDTDQGIYTSEQGNLWTVDRYMPVPYDMTIQVDCWTTNTTNKLELLEQMFVLFNPSLQLQSNDNPLDWSSVFEVKMTDINWSSRGVPSGTDDALDIATLTFEVPIWISPPAKVSRQKIIQRIVSNVHNVVDIDNLGYSFGYYDFFDDLLPDATIVVSPNDYRVSVSGSTAILVDNAGIEQDWGNLIEMQGELTQSSRLELNISNDPLESDQVVIGTVADNPMSTSSLIFNLDADTLPSNTLANVDMIIDPRAVSPGSGLANASTGQRYLLIEDISTDTLGWGFEASSNDIIEYSGSTWEVSFDSSAVTSEQWMTNAFTSAQFKWTGSQWQSSWEGTYNPGFFRLIL